MFFDGSDAPEFGLLSLLLPVLVCLLVFGCDSPGPGTKNEVDVEKKNELLCPAGAFPQRDGRRPGVLSCVARRGLAHGPWQPS